MLIADDLLLLLLDDESGRMTNASYLDVGIGGALLVELALGDHVRAVAQDKVLGFTPKSRIQVTGSTPGDPVLAEACATVAEKERKAQDLVTRRGVTPDERTAAIMALLSALGIVHKVLDREGLPAGDVKRRAKEIADGDWAAQAVKDAVQAAQAAIASAAVVAATAASASS